MKLGFVLAPARFAGAVLNEFSSRLIAFVHYVFLYLYGPHDDESRMALAVLRIRMRGGDIIVLRGDEDPDSISQSVSERKAPVVVVTVSPRSSNSENASRRTP